MEQNPTHPYSKTWNTFLDNGLDHQTFFIDLQNIVQVPDITQCYCFPTNSPALCNSMIFSWETQHISYNIIPYVDHITTKFTNALDDISKFDYDMSKSNLLTTEDKYTVVHTLNGLDNMFSFYSQIYNATVGSLSNQLKICSQEHQFMPYSL